MASPKKFRGEPAPGEAFRLSDVEAADLSKALFGDRPEPPDVERWLGATFRFSTAPGTELGLWQQQGGPCGVFAPVQAFMLRHLLFGEGSADGPASRGQPLAMRDEDQRPALLAYALASVLFNAAPSSSYAVCRVSPGPAGVLGSLAVEGVRVGRVADAQRLLQEGASTWLAGPCGVLSFVVSVLVTRKLSLVREDADDCETPLIGRFGHCSQELVNLMLVGEATSNVFDGNKWLGDDPSTGMMLRGIDEGQIGVPPVGYLSELEPMRYIQVGTLYKNPEFPLWVLGSPTHYTLLFSCDKSDSQLSDCARVDQQAKKVFVESSVDDGGIAMSTHLGKMLEALGIPGSRLAQAELDLVNEDVVLWMDFRNWVRRARGVAEDAAPLPGNRLNMFLYDGQDPPGPTLRTVTVELTDVDPSAAGGNDGDAFTATLHTRWPNSIVTIGAVIGGG